MPGTIGIHGAAGAVGQAAALALACGGAGRLVLADADAARLACLEMDATMLRATLPGLEVVTGDVAALAACDVVVACAGVPHRDGAPRAAFLAENAAILAPLADALAHAASARSVLGSGRPATAGQDASERGRGGPGGGAGAAVVVVSNPVDALTTWLQRRLGPDAVVLGQTLNDTLRLRGAIARVRGCHPSEVEAWSVGEHGPHAVPLLSRVRVRGAPATLAPAERARVLDEVGSWYARWQRHGTGRTSALSSGWGAAALACALLDGDERPWPVATPLRGAYGVEGVALTAPVLLDGGGRAPRVLEWPVAPEERAAIAAAAEAVEAACAGLAAPLGEAA